MSRLYPLHFLTLMFVLLLQFFYEFFLDLQMNQGYNDFYHFILNLFFVSSWGLEEGNSYNLPIWSVSKEIIAYLVFFY